MAHTWIQRQCVVSQVKLPPWWGWTRWCGCSETLVYLQDWLASSACADGWNSPSGTSWLYSVPGSDWGRPALLSACGLPAPAWSVPAAYRPPSPGSAETPRWQAEREVRDSRPRPQWFLPKHRVRKHQSTFGSLESNTLCCSYTLLCAWHLLTATTYLVVLASITSPHLITVFGFGGNCYF